MSFASVGSLGTSTENTSDTSAVLTTTAQLDAGNLGIVAFALDNFNGTDADHSEVTGVVDSSGNTWTKLIEYTNGQTGAGLGATVSVWYTIAASTLALGGTVTGTLANAVTGKAISGWEFTLTAGATLVTESSTQAVGDAADPAAIALSGLNNVEHLWFHALALESAALTYTQDSDYTDIDSATGGGAGAAGMGIYGGFRIVTGTGDTVDVATSSARDHAQVLVALVENVVGQTSLSPGTVAVGAYVRGLIADRFGRVLCEIEPLWGPISWRRNDYGLASFQIAATDDKATELNLRFGNRLMIEFDNGLPAWGGVIDTPRFEGGGVITVNAYSAEYMLSWRRTAKQRTFSGATAGQIFTALVQEAQAAENLGISYDWLWNEGAGYSVAFNSTNILDAVRNVLCEQLTDHDFAFVPVLANGLITFQASFYQQRGRDLPKVALIEGHNLSEEALDSYGTLVNDWYVVGAGVGWGADRLTGEARDDDLVARYGLRQGAAVFGDVDVQTTLTAQAVNLLTGSKHPLRILSGFAHNLAPARYADYDIGDRLRVLLHSYDFDGLDTTMRLTTREYFPDTGACALVLEEVT